MLCFFETAGNLMDLQVLVHGYLQNQDCISRNNKQSIHTPVL